tara:strand:+ start:1641 stop:2255 length:615 start_codon:yes stop_codon:yes gene_type:complete
MEKLELPNFGVIHSRLPKQLYNSLMKEILSIKKPKPRGPGLYIDYENTMISNLTEKGVSEHYFISEKNTYKIYEVIQKMIDKYKEVFPNYLDGIKYLDRNVPLGFKTPWVNFQKKNEYLPLHEHGGVLSYNIWMKIPIKSIFEYNYNSIIGKNLIHRINLTEKDEGRIVLFPAQLQHVVYPFYNSNKIRMSIAGNILLNTNETT